MIPRRALPALLLVLAGILPGCQDSVSPPSPDAQPVSLDLQMGTDLPPDTKEKTDSIHFVVEGTNGTRVEGGWRIAQTASPPSTLFPIDLGFTVTASGMDASGALLWEASADVPSQAGDAAGTLHVPLLAHPPQSTSSRPMNGSVGDVSISPAERTFHAPFRVRLFTPTPGAEIRYTLDGSLPDIGSPLYSEPILVDSSRTLQAMAFHPELFPSSLVSARFHLTADTVLSNRASGKDSSAFTLRLSCRTAGSTIRYRLDDGIPGVDDPIFPESLVVREPTVSLTARAFAPGLEPGPSRRFTWSLTNPAPRFPSRLGLDVGSTGEIRFRFVHPERESRIHWTQDGSRPDSNAPIQVDSHVVDRTTRLRAIAWTPGRGWSPEFDTTLSFAVDTVLQFSTPPGTWDRRIALVLRTSTPLARVHYASGGTLPDTTSPVVTPSDTLWISRDTTFSFLVARPGWTPYRTSATWKIRIQPIQATTPPGVIHNAGPLTLFSPTRNTIVRYTLDGSEPDSSSLVLDAPFVLDSLHSAPPGLRVRAKAWLKDAPEAQSVSFDGTWTWLWGHLLDQRDGQTYRTIQTPVGEWMAQDLRFVPADTLLSTCFPSSLGGCSAGRFYKAGPALSTPSCPSGFCGATRPRGICPEGWGLPGLNDWDNLLGLSDTAGLALSNAGYLVPTGGRSIPTPAPYLSWGLSPSGLPVAAASGKPDRFSQDWTDSSSFPIRCIR